MKTKWFGQSKPINLNSFIEEANFEVRHTPDAPEIARCEYHHLFVYDDMQRGRRNHSMLIGDNKDCTLVATAFTEAQFHLWLRMPDTERTTVVRTVKPPEQQTEEEKKKHIFNIPTTEYEVVKETLPFHVNVPLLVPLHKHDQLDTTEWSDLNRLRNRHDHWAKIKGELWKIPAQRFFELDHLMLNGELFKRERVNLEIPLRMMAIEGSNTKIDHVISDQTAFMYVGIPEVWEPQIDGGYLFRPVHIHQRPSLSRKYYAFTAREEDIE